MGDMNDEGQMEDSSEYNKEGGDGEQEEGELPDSDDDMIRELSHNLDHELEEGEAPDSLNGDHYGK